MVKMVERIEIIEMVEMVEMVKWLIRLIVELKAMWTQTRKANWDIVQTRVANTINAWKSGKFMDLSSRQWSLNSDALTKV